MKERPILMTPENAQKCFDGVKTQTRRIMKCQPDDDAKIMIGEIRTSKGVAYIGNSQSGGIVTRVQCPYGVVGDRLWIREAWHAFIPMGDSQYYKTGIRKSEFRFHDREVVYKGSGEYISKDHPNNAVGKWKPAIHMPRWACRTVVEITEIRVQRVQEINQIDVEAEGCKGEWVMPGKYSLNGHRARPTIEQFKTLWQSINGADSWDANPFVWAMTFKKVTA